MAAHSDERPRVKAAPTLKERVYPEAQFGGFSRWDGALAFLNRVHSLLPNRGVVLDVGCGRGAAQDDACRWRQQLADLRGENRRVIGIDVDVGAGRSNPIIDEFREIPASMRWPADDASVDLALARSVLEHVPDPDAFFRELSRVLKPGGVFAAHTPNRFGYPSVVASLVPNRYHAKVVGKAQGDREEQDVFPTLFRCNTKRKLRSLCSQHGLDSYVYAWEAEPGYLSFSPLLYRVGSVVHRIIPQPFQAVLFVFARRS